MTSRNSEANEADLAEQAALAVSADDEMPGPQIAAGDNADIADLVEQHQGVPSADDDYDR